MCAASFAIPSRLLKVSLAATLFGGCTLAGCAGTQQAAHSESSADVAEAMDDRADTALPPEDESGQAFEPSIRERPLGGVAARAAQPVPVKVGAAPLVYLVDTPQVVQVMDETEGLILAESPVRGRTIVRVDERNGVIAGRDQLYAGPLPEGHRYGIYVVPDAENVSRTGRFIPRPSREVKPTPER